MLEEYNFRKHLRNLLKQFLYMHRGTYQVLYSREEDPSFSDVHEVIHDVDVPRNDDSLILLQSRPFRDPCECFA